MTKVKENIVELPTTIIEELILENFTLYNDGDRI